MTDRPRSTRARLGRSPLAGLPTAPPAEGRVAARQLALPMELEERRAARAEPLPEVVHLAGWLTLAEQRALVGDFRRWALPPAGLRRPRVPSGHLMHVQSVCLGWHWQPYAYSRTADDTDGAPVKPMPSALITLARRAVADAYGPRSAAARSFAPDAAIVNLYAPDAHLGLHRDAEEPSDAPVVTLSLGDTALFRFAGVERRTGPFTDVELASGDLLVFGGANRRIYHGLPRLRPGTAPAGLGLSEGRLSLTVRETGLEG